MNLFLIRHCEGNANAKGLVSGDFKDELSSRGIWQANSLFNYVDAAGLFPKMIYASNWKRAMQTAEIVFPNREIFVASELGETNSGAASVLTNLEFKEKNPKFFDSRKNKFPDGESHEDMFNRVIQFILNHLPQDGDIAFITHAGPITSIIQFFLGVSIASKFPIFVPMHGSITQLQIGKDNNLEHMICFSHTPTVSQFKEGIERELTWP